MLLAAQELRNVDGEDAVVGTHVENDGALGHLGHDVIAVMVGKCQ